VNFACTQNKYNYHLQIYRSIERSIWLSKTRHTHNDYKLEWRAIRHVALYLHMRSSHKFDTTSVSWYNTTMKRVKRNIQPPRATLTALPQQEGEPVWNMHNQISIRKFRNTNECPKLTAYSCTRPLLRLTQFLHTVRTGRPSLGSSVLCDVFALRWFECSSSSKSLKYTPLLMHHPQPSPPTHGSQHADDSSALHGQEVPVGPRLPSGRDDLWADLNGTAHHRITSWFLGGGCRFFS